MIGNLGLGGTLSLVVDVPRYRGQRGDGYGFLTFGSLSGSADSIRFQPVPAGYQFSPRLGANALGMVLVLTPFDSVSPRVTDDEFESLYQKQQEQLDELIALEKERRRRSQKTKQQQDEEEKRRAAASCT